MGRLREAPAPEPALADELGSARDLRNLTRWVRLTLQIALPSSGHVAIEDVRASDITAAEKLERVLDVLERPGLDDRAQAHLDHLAGARRRTEAEIAQRRRYP